MKTPHKLGAVSPERRFARSTGLLIAALCTFVVLGVLSSPRADAQDDGDGLEVRSTTVYTPDVDGEQVDVQASYTLTNVQADEIVGDSVRSFWFTKWIIAMPASITDFRATSDGAALSTLIEANTDDIVFGTISLPFNLNFEQTVTIDVSYTIPGADPRVGGSVARVNDSFLSFSIWASGDPQLTTVRVNVPDGFELDLQGDLEGLVPVDGESYYQATAIAEPRDFFGQVYGRNDTGLLVEVAQLPDATAIVRAWPDDPDWAAFVVDAIEQDVPVIEDLTGLEWPAGDIEVIETLTPYLYGYGGWFNASSGVIEIGENLERDLILHELSHAWFNAELIDGRWITEGLAEEFASRTIEATSDERPDPETPDLDNPLRVQLSQWASPWSLNEEDAFGYEQYHYNASWWVIRQITNDIGVDALSDVLVTLAADSSAYAGPNPDEPITVSPRWIHLFDLLELDAGASNLDELFSTYVLSADDSARLASRRASLATYLELGEVSSEWSTPLVVRQALADWDFDRADELMAAAHQVVEARDQNDARAVDLNVTIEHRAQSSFEAATSSQDISAANELEAEVGAQLQDLETRRLVARELADDLDAEITFAAAPLTDALTQAGTQADLLAGLGDAVAQVETTASNMALLTPQWPMQGADIEAVANLASARTLTLDAIEQATTTVGLERSFLQRVGLWGSDSAGEIAQARAAFEADELDDSLAAAATAESMIASAAATGRTRLIWSGVFVAALLTLAIMLRTRRSRHM